MSQNKSVEEVVVLSFRDIKEYWGLHIGPKSSQDMQEKVLYKIYEKLLQTSQEREREIVEMIIADYMEALGTVVLPQEIWLWIADINGKYLNKTLKENI